MDHPKTTGPSNSPVAPEGVPIIATFVVIGALLSWAAFHWLGTLSGWVAAVVCGALSVWCVWFFRDPERKTPGDARAVVSPADGVVCLIDRADPPTDLALSGMAGAPRVAVFMNVFNVHVNRAPVGGTIRAIRYREGKFLNASLDKASVDNERSAMAIEMPDGRCVVAVQIAGLVARRIVSRVREGMRLEVGERYGLIRFGSRVDVYMPEGSEIRVRLGQRVVAGETILAMVPAASGASSREAASVARA